MRACFAAEGNLLDTVRGSAPDGGTGDRPLRDRQAILDEAFLYAVHGNCFAAADRLLDCGACILRAEYRILYPMPRFPPRVSVW